MDEIYKDKFSNFLKKSTFVSNHFLFIKKILARKKEILTKKFLGYARSLYIRLNR